MSRVHVDPTIQLQMEVTANGRKHAAAADTWNCLDSHYIQCQHLAGLRCQTRVDIRALAGAAAASLYRRAPYSLGPSFTLRFNLDRIAPPQVASPRGVCHMSSVLDFTILVFVGSTASARGKEAGSQNLAALRCWRRHCVYMRHVTTRNGAVKRDECRAALTWLSWRLQQLLYQSACCAYWTIKGRRLDMHVYGSLLIA
jgi:hypothetical protein